MERVRVPLGGLIAWGVGMLLVISTATLSPASTATEGTNAVSGSEAGLSSSSIAPGGRVRDITLRVDGARRGLGAWSETWGDNLVFDKNRDGNPDVLLSYHQEQGWQIWMGKRRGGFSFDQALRKTDRHNCVAADFGGPHHTRRDGRTDLYCVRGAGKGTLKNKRNALLIQRAGGGFENEVRSWRAADPAGRGRTVSVLNIRGNGKPSLFLGNAKSVQFPSLDRILVNVGKRFRQRRTGGLPSEQKTFCSATGDFDHDGRQDFLSCSYSVRLYRNLTTRRGPVSYREVAEREGVPNGRRWDAELVDLNRDGWRDLVIVSTHRLVVRLNRHQTPHFSEVDFSFPLSAGSSFCSGRANGDAATDLLVVQGLASRTDRRQRRDWMLVNRGGGKAFRALPVPQPPSRNGRNGFGDTCTAIPRYAGNRAAWTINNGKPTYTPRVRHHRGYRQLVILAR
jgi:VCBS repeat protein